MATTAVLARSSDDPPILRSSRVFAKRLESSKYGCDDVLKNSRSLSSKVSGVVLVVIVFFNNGVRLLNLRSGFRVFGVVISLKYNLTVLIMIIQVYFKYILFIMLK